MGKSVVSPENASAPKPVRLHLTNVVGLGAVALLRSLLPALAACPGYSLPEVYLPATGELAALPVFDEETVLSRYRRHLPNSVSRLLECTLFGGKFAGATPLLVFGDIPLRCRAAQTVLVQTPLLVRGAATGRRLGAGKYWVARWLFRRNLRYVTNLIVQTEAMRLELLAAYPEIGNRIHIIPQPPPGWLLKARLRRTGFQGEPDAGLRLFYPAATYPHKNHRLLGTIIHPELWPIAELILTIPEALNPGRALPWLRCVGTLPPEGVLANYRVVDGLLFLSLSESYGFPLIEAMWIGLPIICPDLPYARTLCGEQAIYFESRDIESLRAAVSELARRRRIGWWPDWSSRLALIPRDWAEVAEQMLCLASVGMPSPAASGTAEDGGVRG